MKVAVLAVQGAFIEHEKALHKIGIETVELREPKDLEQNFTGLILPGGESTAQGKLLRELDMFDTLKEKIEGGMPVLATCAGLRQDYKRQPFLLPYTACYCAPQCLRETVGEFLHRGKIRRNRLRSNDVHPRSLYRKCGERC